MKQKIRYSYFSLIATVLVLAIFVGGIFMLIESPFRLTFFCIIMGLSLSGGLYYCPVSIELTERGILLHRLLSLPKFFSYDSLEEVDTFRPSAGGIRLCGSGGFFGYWGYFSDIMTGTYFGYYGDRSHCFMIKLDTGRQYVIGCDDAKAIVKSIKAKTERVNK